MTDTASLFLKADFNMRQRGVEDDMETRKSGEGWGGIRKVARQNLIIFQFLPWVTCTQNRTPVQRLPLDFTAIR